MGSPETDRVARQRFRMKLEKWRMAPREIDLCLDQIAERQQLKNNGLLALDAPLCTRAEYVRLLRINKPAKDDSAAVLHLGDDYQSPDAKGFTPTRIDPLFNGVGRVSGTAAKVVRRKMTINKYEHDKDNEKR